MTDIPTNKHRYDNLNDYQRDVLLAWHQKLTGDDREKQDIHDEPSPKVYIPKLDSGSRARIRRAQNLQEIAMLPAFHTLYHSISQSHPAHNTDEALDAWLLTTALIAEVKNHIPNAGNSLNDLPYAAGCVPADSDKPTISPARFQQLLKSASPEEFLTRMRRIIQHAGAQLDVIKLAQDVLQWHHEHRHPDRKAPSKRLTVKWASRYYNTDHNKKHTTSAN